ncbi:MAG: transglycosylase domain-containing protein [Clostridiales bacterium]|jgi:penicillin-binding protein 1A|nr:transglycosylase domain-containing protein [Clostridiales bacterium]
MSSKNKTIKKLSRNEILKLIKRKKKIKIFFWGLFLFFLLTLLCLVLGIYNVIGEFYDIKNINLLPSSYSTIIYENKNNTEIDRLNGDENREYITLDKIPINLQRAFISIEDERFYQHNGIDLKALLRAVITKIFKKKTQGASTITQQVIKNNVTKVSKNNIKTKIQEQYLAIRLEQELSEEFKIKKISKDYILEIYLNSIYLYHNLNGVKTAANFYFDKNVSDLTLDECAVIAAITKSPTYYAPDKNPENNKIRRNLILNKMYELNYINQEELDKALNEDSYKKIKNSKNVNAEKSYHSYFVDRVIKDVVNDFEKKLKYSHKDAMNLIYNGGLKIYTTIDLDIQKILDKNFCNEKFFPKSDFELDIQYLLTVENKDGEIENLEKNKVTKNEKETTDFINDIKKEISKDNYKILSERVIKIIQPQAAMIIIDYHNGEVKAVYGSRGKKITDRALNRATDCERQPGSVFKILASYAPSIDLKKTTTSSIIIDEPYKTPDGYEPKNYYKNYRGPSTIRDGIRDSMNILAVKNMISTGVNSCFNYLLKFGFTTLVERKKVNNVIYSDIVASTALGGITRGVTQLELTAAYGTIANLGIYKKPIFYTKVLDRKSNVLLENKIINKKVLSAQTSYILTDLMQDVIKNGTGRKVKFVNSKISIAGKTGTTSDTKDLNFVGYTPYYVASIWFGFDHPKKMYASNGYHLILWRDTMEKIHSNLLIKDFEKPNGLKQIKICKETGKIASDYCDRVSNEYFIFGTEPIEICDAHESQSKKEKNNENIEKNNSDKQNANQDNNQEEDEIKDLDLNKKSDEETANDKDTEVINDDSQNQNQKNSDDNFNSKENISVNNN